MFAMKTHACADSMDRSKSFASLRHLPSHAKVRSTIRCTMLRGTGCPAWRFLAGWAIEWRNPKDDLYLRVVDFDPADHGTDDLLRADPVKAGEPYFHLG